MGPGWDMCWYKEYTIACIHINMDVIRFSNSGHHLRMFLFWQNVKFNDEPTIFNWKLY